MFLLKIHKNKQDTTTYTHVCHGFSGELTTDNTEFPKPPVTPYSLSHAKLSVRSQIAVTASYSHLQSYDMQKFKITTMKFQASYVSRWKFIEHASASIADLLI
jgi:hypothetical protein